MAWRLVGVRRGLANPNICNRCSYHWGTGHISDITVMIASCEEVASMMRAHGPETASILMERFFKLCSDIVVDHDGIVEKYGAHGAIAYFNTPIKRVDHVDQAVTAATEIQLGAGRVRVDGGEGEGLPVGISIDTGTAYARSVGSGKCEDYTVLGDVVEIASGLQEQAGSGGILVTEQVYQYIESAFPKAQEQVLRLRGVPEPVRSCRLS